jgi:hypothetical protein
LATPQQPTAPSRSWRVILIVLVVVAVVGGVAYILLKGGNDHVGTGAKPGSNTPPFDFQLSRTKGVPTAANGKIDQGAVSAAAKDIDTTLTNMYALAFLDPDKWKKNDYDAAFGFFAEGKAAASAKRDEATLTLGPTAGDTFDDVQPRNSRLSVRLLTDRGGKPVASAVTADFIADATKKDGSIMVIKSHATYYLRPTGEGWIIVGYQATRADEFRGQPVSPSGASS